MAKYEGDCTGACAECGEYLEGNCLPVNERKMSLLDVIVCGEDPEKIGSAINEIFGNELEAEYYEYIDV